MISRWWYNWRSRNDVDMLFEYDLANNQIKALTRIMQDLYGDKNIATVLDIQTKLVYWIRWAHYYEQKLGPSAQAELVMRKLKKDAEQIDA